MLAAMNQDVDDNDNDGRHSNNDNNNDGWTTVTATDKKRVMRRGGNSTTKGRSRKNKTRNIVAHSTTSGDAAVASAEELCHIVSQAQNAMEQTVFYRQAREALLSLQSSSFLSMGQENSKSDNGAATAQWNSILCLGVGNFARTGKQQAQYSASLWQLAFALQLQQDLFMINDNEATAADLVIKDHDKQPIKDDVNESVQSTTKKAPSIRFHDPACTEIELTCLQKLSVQLVSTTTSSTDNGNKEQNSSSKAWLTVNSPTICFMPHCPVSLYEELMAQNQDNYHNLCIVGNSLINHCESLQIKQNLDIPHLRSLQPDLHEQRLDNVFVSAQHKDAAKDGNFIGAFNDTYLTYIPPKPPPET